MKKKTKPKYSKKLTRKSVSESSLNHLEKDMDPTHKNTFRIMNVLTITLVIVVLLVSNLNNFNIYAFVILLGVLEYFIALSLEKRFHKETPCYNYFCDTTTYFLLSVGFFVVNLVYIRAHLNASTLSFLHFTSMLLGALFFAVGFERMCHLGFTKK